jgi:hypothetical protein
MRDSAQRQNHAARHDQSMSVSALTARLFNNLTGCS